MPASSRFSSSPNPEVARLWRGRWSGVPYRYRSELVFWRAACYRQLFGAALPLQSRRSSGDSRHGERPPCPRRYRQSVREILLSHESRKRTAFVDTRHYHTGALSHPAR